MEICFITANDQRKIEKCCNMTKLQNIFKTVIYLDVVVTTRKEDGIIYHVVKTVTTKTFS